VAILSYKKLDRENTKKGRCLIAEGFLIFKDQLQYVAWRHQLMTVVHHYKQLDKQ
jgi:hypothetical protein